MRDSPADSTDDQKLPTEQRIDVVCDAFESQWLSGERPDVAEHIASADEGDRASLLFELVRLDVDYRRQTGEAPSPADYIERFPEFAFVIARAFGDSHTASIGDGDEHTTTYVRDRPNGSTSFEDGAFTLTSEAHGAGHAQDGSDAPTPLPVIEGYQVKSKLGAGGMGAVWQAVQLSTGRDVALKTIKGAFASDAARLRFQREVELSARLDHPNIAQVFDSGRCDDVDYFAMRLVQGESLDRYVRGNSLATRAILELMQVVCRTVQHAHQRGVIHRDLKPANILVDRHGAPHVLDFGLAKAQLDQAEGERNDFTLTREGAVAGTLAYMAPEQAAGRTRDIDTRSDLYALGVILYRLLTGNPPHDMQGSSIQVIQRIVGEDVRLPRQFAPRIDRDLEAILLKALAKHPAERYSSASELADDIGRFLTGEPVTARVASAFYLLRKHAWKYRFPLGVATVALTVVVAAALFYALTMKAEQTKTHRQYLRAELQTIEADEAQQEAVSALKLQEQATLVAKREQAAADAARARAEKLRQQAEASQAREARLRARSEELYYASLISLAHRDWADGEFVAARMTLTKTPPGLRGWEYDYLNHLFNGNNRQVGQNIGWVHFAAYNHDASRIFSIGDHGKIYVWDTATNKVVAEHTMGSRLALAVCSPNRKQVAYLGEDGAIALCDIDTGMPLRQWTPEKDKLTRAAFSPDGKQLAAIGTTIDGGKSSLTIWDATMEGEIERLELDAPRLNALDYRRDGKQLVIASAASLLLFDTAPLKLVEEVKGLRAGAPSDVIFYEEQRVLVGAPQYYTYDFAARRSYLPLSEQGHLPRGLTIDPTGGYIAAADYENLIRVWDIQKYCDVRTYRGQSGQIIDLDFSPDGKQLLVSGVSKRLGGEMRVYDLDLPFPNSHWHDENTFFLNNVGGSSLAVSPDGKQVVVGRTWRTGVNGFHVYEVGTLNHKWAVTDAPHPTYSMAFLPTRNQLLALAGKPDTAQKLGLWDTDTGELVQEFDELDAVQRRLALHPDGKIAASNGHDSLIHVWDIETGKLIRTLKGAGGGESAEALAFSPDGTMLLVSMYAGRIQSGLHRWDTRSWQLIPGKGPIEMRMTDFAFTADGKHLLIASYEHIKMLDAQSLAPVREFRGHVGTINCLALSPDGTRLASGSDDETVKVWNVASGQELITLKGHLDAIKDVVFTNDGRQLLSTGDDQRLKIWDAGPAPPERTINEASEIRQEIESKEYSTYSWQSFTATSNGYLTRLALRPSAYVGISGHLSIYQGTGTNGRLLHRQDYHIDSVSGAPWRAFQPTTPVRLYQGETYTIDMTGANGLVHADQDVYPGGQATWRETDLCFRVFIEPSADPKN